MLLICPPGKSIIFLRKKGKESNVLATLPGEWHLGRVGDVVTIMDFLCALVDGLRWGWWPPTPHTGRLPWPDPPVAEESDSSFCNDKSQKISSYLILQLKGLYLLFWAQPLLTPFSPNFSHPTDVSTLKRSDILLNWSSTRTLIAFTFTYCCICIDRQIILADIK